MLERTQADGCRIGHGEPELADSSEPKQKVLYCRAKKNQRKLSMDSLGIAASSLCLIHCALMPFILVALPYVGLQFLAGNFAHRVSAIFVITFALLAVLPGYLKHRKICVLATMLFGLLLVLTATFVASPAWGEGAELLLISVGNVSVVTAHIINRKLCQCHARPTVQATLDSVLLKTIVETTSSAST